MSALAAISERTIFEKVADPQMGRADVATSYAYGLRNLSLIDWPAVNKAIMARWSPAGLRWIKDRAWKLAERR